MSLGGGGSNTTTQEFKPPGWTEDMWKAYANAGLNISQTPYVQSGIPTVAPVNDYQNSAYQLAYDRALYGAPDLNAGRGAAMAAAQGNLGNPWEGAVQDFLGPNSPYLSDASTEQMIQNNANNMSQAAAMGSMAQTDANAYRSGTFGGSGYLDAQDRNKSALAKQVGDMATQTRQQQQQFKTGAALQAMGMGSGIRQNDVQNMLQGAGLAGQLSQDDYKSIEGLNQAGNAQSGYYQKLLDQLNNQWGTQNSYDATMNEYLGSVLGRASGSYGGTASTQGGGNGLAGLLGLLGVGAGAYTLYR